MILKLCILSMSFLLRAMDEFGGIIFSQNTTSDQSDLPQVFSCSPPHRFSHGSLDQDVRIAGRGIRWNTTFFFQLKKDGTSCKGYFEWLAQNKGKMVRKLPCQLFKLRPGGSWSHEKNIWCFDALCEQLRCRFEHRIEALPLIAPYKISHNHLHCFLEASMLFFVFI